MTQEALAERAGLSARAISDLERGLRRAPRRETVRLLADALGLDAPARGILDAAARPPRRATPRSLNAGPVLAPRLVGRTAELETLRAGLESAQAGSGSLVLLGGEPGIGKTRLLEEVAAEAGRRGMQVLWGRCWESEGAPPFWPWVEVLRGFMRNRAPAALRTDLGSGAGLIAELVPELRNRLPDLPPTPRLEAVAARFQLFDSVAAALQNASGAQPLVLLLDDLHGADKPSLLLLQFLVQYVGSSRILVVAAYRDTELQDRHPLGELLGALRRERSFASIAVKGLTPGAVGELAESILDQQVPTDAPALGRAIWQLTEGNPLFVREELHTIIEHERSRSGRPTEGSLLELGVPQGVRDVISRRLARLAVATNEVLTIAAVIGREFEAATLQGASGLSDIAMDAALDEAQAALIIEEIPRTVGRYRFHHALFREVLYAGLPGRRRSRLHGTVAQALERRYAADFDVHLTALAHHFGQAQTLLGPDKLVHYSLLAGERALETRAYEEAVVHFQRGIAAVAGRPMDAPQAALLFGLGRALTATAELPRAHEIVAHLTRAFDFYEREKDLDRAVAVAECPVDALPGQPVGAARLVARALVLVEPDSHAMGRLLARYARIAAIENGDYPAAAAACNRALAIARHKGDVRLEIQALGNGAEADLNFMCWQDGLEKCFQAESLASRTDDLQAQMLARFFASIILLLSGELRRAGAQAAALLAQAEQLRDRRWVVSALWIDGTVARYRGDWPEARERIERGLALSPEDPRLLWTCISLDQEVGNFGKVNSLLDRLVKIVPLSTPRPDLAVASTALVTAIAAGRGPSSARLDLAESATEAMLSVPSATGMVLRQARCCLAALAIYRRDVVAAGRHYAALRSARGTIIYEGMVADRLLGLLAQTMGDHAAAIGHFQDAISFCEESGCRSELAWSAYDYAALLWWRDERADRTRAQELLDKALEIAAGLGMGPLLERTLHLRPLSDDPTLHSDPLSQK